MKINTGLKPRTLIDQALRDAKQTLDTAAQGGVLSPSARAQLPAALQKVADTFDSGDVKTQDVLGQLKTSLEGLLQNSLAQGQLLGDEVAGVLDRLELGSLGIQAQQILAASKTPDGAAALEKFVSGLLTTADATAGSQIALFEAMKQTADAHQAENPGSKTARFLKDAVKDRGKFMRKAVQATLKEAEAGFKQAGSDEAKVGVQAALQAAIDVHQATAPTGARLKQLRKKLDKYGAADALTAQTQPFFARFLESQVTQGEMPSIEQGEKPGTYVTLKFPSDNEDGGGGEIGEVVTKKFPSDQEDGGAGDEGGVGDVVTKKFPSDAEDGGADGPGDITTAKFPSDAEDGGAGDDGGMMVTMKYPSDNEDGGGAELIVEIAPEVRNELIPEIAPEVRNELIPEIAPEIRNELIPEIAPEVRNELIPEIAPEIRNELIPEIAPEIRPEVGPGETDQARTTRMLRTEQAVMKAGYYGFDKVQERIGEIDNLFMTARLTPDAARDLSNEQQALKTFLGGAWGIERKIDELQKLPMVALLTEQGMKDLQAEIAMYAGLLKDIQPLKDRFDQLAKRRHHSMPEYAEMAVLKRAHGGGLNALSEEVTRLSGLLDATPAPLNADQLSLELKGIQAWINGADFMQERIDTLKSNLLNAGGTQQVLQPSYDELALLQALMQQIEKFKARSLEIDNKIENPPEVAPELVVELAPELMPELMPELIVEVMPELRPELIPELAPEVVIELRPEVIAEIGPELIPELRPEVRPFPELIPEIAPELQPELVVELAPEIAPEPGDQKRAMLMGRTEQAVNKAAFGGAPQMRERIGQIENTMRTARLTAEAHRALSLELKALVTFMGGRESLDNRIAELRRMPLVALMTEEGMKDLQAEIGMYEMLRIDHGALQRSFDKLGDQPTLTKAEEAQLRVLKHAATGGFNLVEQRITEIDDLMTRARLSPEGMAALELERTAMKAFLHGGPNMAARIDEIDDLLPRAMMTPEAHEAITNERATLKGLYNDIQQFQARADAIDKKLDDVDINPEVAPEVIVEVAPELIPELRPELIAEIAPEVRPLPELIAEIAPDLLGSDDDED